MTEPITRFPQGKIKNSTRFESHVRNQKSRGMCRLCSELERSNCCDIGVLDASLSNDWSNNDVEEWGESWMGDCKDKEFKVHLMKLLNTSGQHCTRRMPMV